MRTRWKTWWPVVAASWSWPNAVGMLVGITIFLCAACVSRHSGARARERCARLYSEARTAADTAAVDREVAPVTRSLFGRNCETLRRSRMLPPVHETR